MYAMLPISEISLPGNNLSTLNDARIVNKHTKAESTDAIQSKSEVPKKNNIKSNLRENGVGTNIDFYI